jgi:hypothetical protein
MWTDSPHRGHDPSAAATPLPEAGAMTVVPMVWPFESVPLTATDLVWPPIAAISWRVALRPMPVLLGSWLVARPLAGVT